MKPSKPNSPAKHALSLLVQGATRAHELTPPQRRRMILDLRAAATFAFIQGNEALEHTLSALATHFEPKP